MPKSFCRRIALAAKIIFSYVIFLPQSVSFLAAYSVFQARACLRHYTITADQRQPVGNQAVETNSYRVNTDYRPRGGAPWPKERVRRMNNIRNRAEEIVLREVICV